MAQGAVRSMHGMASVLAHEIKNPLAGIRGAAQLLEEQLPPGERDMTQADLRGERPHPRPDRPHGSFRRHQQLCQRHPVNIHEVLARVRQIAETGFARGVTIHRKLSIPRCRRWRATATS